jgi:predicted transposase YbfD/YdcC
MLHMISAYATEARFVLAQEKVSEKSNEITAIPKLLEWLDLKGNTVTIDAMGCQFEIANQIIKQEGQYIFSLKGNQGTLHEDVRTYLQDMEVLDKLLPYTDYDKGHGRLKARTCFVCNDLDWLTKRHPNWRSIKSIVRIDSVREDKKKISKETSYYYIIEHRICRESTKENSKSLGHRK